MGDQNRIIILSVSVGVICLGLGVIIGYFSKDDVPSWVGPLQQDVDEDILKKYINNVKAENIMSNLREYTKYPHMAGTDQDNALVNTLKNTWEGTLHDVYVTSHDVMLSYPDPDDVNRAVVMDADGNAIFTTTHQEDVLEEMENPEFIVQYFNAFAPAGEVKGCLVFANYGTVEDFKALDDLGVNMTGCIALTKYGRTGRGTRTNNAQPYGVGGVLVYSDPEDYVFEGDKGYPDDFSLPPTGVQRGSTMGEFGDPTTPRFPSKKYAYRVPEDEIDVFPVLPLTPINYADAETLLNMLAGQNPPSGFTTRLNVDTLTVGPQFENDTQSLQLTVNNKLTMVESKNVIGVIKGSEEPETYVMYGNHRDSWVYGAVDPSSGTACMMEMTRVLGQLLDDGWRPKRTMVFGSWGSEEFGLIGSTEWAEENAQLFEGRAVSYINVDIAVFANETFFARASPIMKKALMKAAMMVDDPVRDISVLENWINYHPDSTGESPNIGKLFTSSDYAYFYQTLGISSADLSYRGNTSNPRYQISPYPTYHTAYDTFNYVNSYLDPGFTSHETVAKVAGTAMILLADSLVLPYDARDFANYIQFQITQTETVYGGKFQAKEISLEYLIEAGKTITSMADMLHAYIDGEMDQKNPSLVKKINTKLMTMEKSFIEPFGLPNELNLRHISGSPATNDESNDVFPSLQDALYGIADDDEAAWKVVRQQLAMITYRINNAAKMLNLEHAFV